MIAEICPTATTTTTDSATDSVTIYTRAYALRTQLLSHNIAYMLCQATAVDIAISN